MLFRKKKEQAPDLGKILSEYNRSLSLIVDRKLHIENFKSRIKQLCDTDIIHIFLLDSFTEKYKLQYEEDKNKIIFSSTDRLISWLSVNDTYLLISRNKDIFNWFYSEEQMKLETLQAELIYPLKIMNRINGLVLLGSKNDGTFYSDAEIKLLSLFFDQASFAIEYSTIYEIQTERIKKMYRTDRLATLGELAAGAAHEIRNPLTSISSTIQYLSKDFEGDSEKTAMVEELISEVDRINNILQGLLSFARTSKLNLTTINVQDLIEQTLLLSNNSLRKRNIEIQREYFCEQPYIKGDSEQLKQVFLNIVMNAADAISENPERKERNIIISIENTINNINGEKHLIISFEDSGMGMDDDKMERLFNPFYTTKENGTGLGLAICYGIINRHNGEILVNSKIGQGSIFIIKLPQNS